MDKTITCDKSEGTFAQRFVGNLKALNAKERDHLMRLAYLGRTRAYENQHDGWISEAMEQVLRTRLTTQDGGKERPILHEDARCVFAGMDYHLDWLYAALELATCGESASLKKGVRMPSRENPGYGMTPSDLPKYAATLRPVSGRQEDVDLLVVFAGAEGDIQTTTLLLIEAKGVGAIDSEQLARKLVRIDRILDSSRAKALGINAKFVLALPEGHTDEPARSALEHARRCKDSRLVDLLSAELHQVGIGRAVDSHTFTLQGFPKNLQKVTRVKEKDSDAGEEGDGHATNAPDKYTHWAIRPRRRPKEKPENGTSTDGTRSNQENGTPAQTLK